MFGLRKPHLRDPNPTVLATRCLNRRENGYGSDMKFTLGFITGIAVGGFLAANMTEQQRARTTDAAARAASRVQDSTVARAVTRNAGQVSGAASERVADVVDTAGDSIADAIQPTTNVANN